MELSWEVIQAYRAGTFCLAPGMRLHDRQQAVEFVNRRGFVYFWPIRGVTLPSLWVAVAGDRPVADEHDDPGHVTWGWKDALLGGREWYYAKVLRKKATMISFAALPYFYALSENYGAPEEDYLTLYEQGRLTAEAKIVYEALLERGPLDTLELRRVAHLNSPASESRFNRAMVALQSDFKVLPVGVADVGAWHYAFIYDLVTRRYPELPDLAHPIRERQARQWLAECYFRTLGAAQLPHLASLFGWRLPAAEHAVEALLQAGTLRRSLRFAGQAGDWIVLANLAEANLAEAGLPEAAAQ